MAYMDPMGLVYIYILHTSIYHTILFHAMDNFVQSFPFLKRMNLVVWVYSVWLGALSHASPKKQ